MRYFIILISIFLTTNAYSGIIYSKDKPICETGEDFRRFKWDKEEQKKIEKMTEKERESYELNEWFEENKGEIE